MWYLVSSTNPDTKYVLLVGKELLVGRKDCDVTLATDPAVSRKHASLQMAHAESNLSHPQKSALVTLKDLSKFGTWVNKKRVTEEALVKDGDEIVFGSPKSIFLVVNEPFVMTTSCLDVASKKSMKAIVRTFGGHIVSEWTKQCSLLVMNNISVTIKVICALITQKSIVLPGYLEKLHKHYTENADKPNPDNYQPIVSETQVNPEEVSFNPNPRRSSVFEGMKFIFLSQKQFKKMNLAVELAGGMPILMEEGSDDNDDRVLAEPGTVVMNCGAEEVKTLTAAGQEWVVHVNKYLKSKKKNVIQDAEIGYAVLYCSTEKHCNPDIDQSDQIFKSVPSQSLSQCGIEQSIPDVLVANTEVSPGRQRRERRSETGGAKVLDETILTPQVTSVKTETVSQGSTTPAKRKRGNEPNAETVPQESKRIKQEPITPGKTQETIVSRESRAQRAKRPSPSRSPKPRSRSPSPSPSRRSTRLQKSSPEREGTPTGEVKSNGRQKRSTSPKPETSKPLKMEVVESDDDVMEGGRSRSPKKTMKKKTGNSKVHEISDDESNHIEEVTEKSVKKPSPKTKRKAMFDDSDDDEDIGLWQRGRRKKENRGDNSDIMDIPSSKKRTNRTKDDDEDNLFDDIPSSRVSNVQSKTENVSVIEEENLFDDIPSSKSERTKQPERKIKQEVSLVLDQSEVPTPRRPKRETEEMEEEEESTDDPPKSRAPGTVTERGDGNHNLPDGFLTTRMPIKNQVIKREDFLKEDDKPTSVVITEFTSLVAKRTVAPKKSRNNHDSESTPEGYTKWNGKLVKNYKKFKKTSHAGANFLPRIIGGSDLVAHTGSQRRDMEEWFKEAQQADSQENEREREALDLFNWEPPAGRKRSR